MATFVFPDIPGQMGLASTRQLLALGATEWDLTRLAVRGQRVVRAVYRSGVGDLTADQLLMAGALWAGPGSVLTGSRALIAHGLLPRFDALGPLRFLVPPEHRTRRNTLGMVTQRTRRMPRSAVRQGIPVAVAERALVGAAQHRELSASRLKGTTIALLQQGITTLDRLSAEIASEGDANTGPIQDGMLAFRAGAWSPPEEALIAAVAADPRFPAMLANVPLEDRDGCPVGTPDGFFPDEGVVVQVHSRLFHTGVDSSGRDRWVTTLERDTAYHRVGLTVVPVAPQTLDEDLPGFLATLLLVLEAHAGRGSSRVVVRPPRNLSHDLAGPAAGI